MSAMVVKDLWFGRKRVVVVVFVSMHFFLFEHSFHVVHSLGQRKGACRIGSHTIVVEGVAAHECGAAD